MTRLGGTPSPRMHRRSNVAGILSAGCWVLHFALAVHCATAECLRAQEPERVSGEVTCAECVITLDTVVTIGGLDGPGLDVISMFSDVAVDQRGRILVWSEAEISVFDSTGSYLRTVGRRGEGPGEYRSISHIDVGPRYIHVFDRHEGRTMLDHDFEVVRTDRFPGQVLSAAVLGDDVVVFIADVPTSASVAHVFRMLLPSGKMTSYGYDGAVHSPELMTLATTKTAVTGKDDTVWAVPREINRLVRWDLVPEPKMGRVFDRRVPEFDEGGDAFAPASVGSAMMDDRGLWLVWHTADPDWTGQLPSYENLTPSSIDIDQLRDSWLDLVDPHTGRTIARYHQDDALGGFAGGSGCVVDYEETDAGVPYLHILEPRLSRR